MLYERPSINISTFKIMSKRVSLAVFLLSSLLVDHCLGEKTVMSENPSPSESRPETSEEAGQMSPRETKRAYHLVEHLMPKERIHIGPPPFVGTWEEMNRLPKWEHIEEAIRVLKREEELKHTFNRP